MFKPRNFSFDNDIEEDNHIVKKQEITTSYTIDELSNISETILNDDMLLDGGIECNTHLKVLCKINGDVKCPYNLIATNDIVGNVVAYNIDLIDCNITGNVIALNRLNLSLNASINGNVLTKSGLLSGKISGMVNCDESLVVTNTAQIIGDITCGSISIKNGAKIIGNVEMFTT